MCKYDSQASSPPLPVEAAVLEGFGQMRRLDGVRSGQIGDGAGDFQDLVVAAGGEAQLLHRLAQQLLGRGGKVAAGARIHRRHQQEPGGERQRPLGPGHLYQARMDRGLLIKELAALVGVVINWELRGV